MHQKGKNWVANMSGKVEWLKLNSKIYSTKFEEKNLSSITLGFMGLTTQVTQ